MHAKISVLQYPATMSGIILGKTGNSWGLIGLSSVLRPLQHSIGYMEDGFYMSKDPTNSIKVLKEKAVKERTPKTKKTEITHAHTPKIVRQIQHKHNKSPSLQ